MFNLYFAIYQSKNVETLKNSVEKLHFVQYLAIFFSGISDVFLHILVIFFSYFNCFLQTFQMIFLETLVIFLDILVIFFSDFSSFFSGFIVGCLLINVWERF